MFALDYHETTKHHFDRFARSAGRLDWATQPDPFRSFAGAPRVELPRDAVRPDAPYGSLYAPAADGAPMDEQGVGDFLRCAMGLSAWKQYKDSRWALRVNPSSGNLHPTECYVVRDGCVSHYLPREHALETRGRLPAASWPSDPDAFLVGLSSVFWREAWKYGERAFRYCQHDVGHALGALRFSAARLGWRMRLLPWPDPAIAALLGLDRDADFADAEREAPECLAIVVRHDGAWPGWTMEAGVRAAHAGTWTGGANRLSPRHVDWSIIGRVAAATEFEGAGGAAAPAASIPDGPVPAVPARAGSAPGAEPSARALMLQRRSAVAFDAQSSLPSGPFFDMLERLRPEAPPWDVVDWTAEVDLAIFVHRVDGLTPGLYAFVRSGHREAWQAAMRRDFLWEPVVREGQQEGGRLFLLLPIDTRWPAVRMSCDQDIAGDGFFSLGMLARFEHSLAERGEWFYRRLFWECGLIGQVLYLEAERVGGRGTGIGCFYDDVVHEVLGLTGRSWQSLYHFSMGIPVNDPRIAVEIGYEWEAGAAGAPAGTI